ncbi:uncharacterized protein DUF3800 [Tissierella praeacuta]|uniref:DUF3800 domain-containing protein n=1 Tax=Tissierella praeacuta TaxID=43131 RepID=UPI001049093D|nr:DUF3800 domain-containing protein [Tissierella praeacuta]TCU79321.1 uncharacterized protein DUF3800 [Tissierella praeacuta]
MSYYVFFDESGKIDRQKNKYSYYGALGIKKNQYEYINDILYQDEKNRREMHFQKFNLTDIDWYLNVLFEVFNKATFNVYLVDRDKAINIADRLSLSPTKLRELLYIKIPERLIYGILRHLNDFYNVNIYIDNCDEYDKYEIESKLEYQLNAQAVYRNKKYLINNVNQIDSKEDIILQATDVILGIISFLVEKKYYSLKDNLTERDYNYITKNLNKDDKEVIVSNYSYNEKNKEYIFRNKSDKRKFEETKSILKKYNYYTQSSIQKCELIYRLLDNMDIIDKINTINIYLWENDGEGVDCQSISEYISKFLLFKSKFDDYNKTKVLNYYKGINAELNLKDYEEVLGLGRNCSNLVKRYLEELKINYKN